MSREKECFENIKKEYALLREEQRRRIIDRLANQKDESGQPLFTKISGQEYDMRSRYRGGMGRSKYGKKHLNLLYDLSNWKYIETKYKDKYIFISLQCFDIDPISCNLHVLYDRIGIYWGDASIEKICLDETKVSVMFTKMKTTNWELPLSNTDLDSLIEYIKTLCI